MNWYKTAQLEQELYNKYLELAKEFIKENEKYMHHKLLTDANWAAGACGMISVEFIDFLAKKSIGGKTLSCSGLKPELPQDAAKQWQNFRGEGQEYLWHCVVETEDAIIDLTGGQYGKIFSGIQVKAKEEYLQNWDSSEPFDYDKYMTTGEY